MGYLDTVQLPGGAKASVPSAPKPTSGYLSSVSIPQNPAEIEAQKIAQLRASANKATEEANQSSSIFGTISNAFSTLPSFSDVWGGLQEVGSDIYSALTKPAAPKTLDVGKSLSAGFDTLSSTIIDAGQRLDNAVQTAFDDHSTALQKGVAVGEAGIGALNALFTPITSSLATVSEIPGIGEVADGLTRLFDAIGTGGSDYLEGIVESLPISSAAKDSIMPLAQEIGALSAQVIAGKAGGDVFNAIAQKSKILTKSVQVEAKKLAIKDETPTETPVDFSNKYTPPDQLPTIEMGQKGAPKQPVIQTEDFSNLPSIETKVPVSRGTLKPVEGTGAEKARGLSEGIEAKAIEEKLVDTFGDLPTYRTVDMADQAQKAATLMTKDYEGAKDIALGRKNPPKGLLPESVLVAVEKRALQEGDISLLRDLAVNSRLSYEATTMGQRIRTLAERDPSSPVGLIKSVQDAREAAFKDKKVDIASESKRLSEEIKSEVRNASKKETWDDFVKQLTCAVE